MLIGKTYFIFIILAYLLHRGGGEGKGNITKKYKIQTLNVKNKKNTKTINTKRTEEKSYIKFKKRGHSYTKKDV